MSVPQIVDRITGAAPAEEAPDQAASTAPESFDITIPEGWRIEQIAEEYARLGGKGGAQAFLDAVKGIDRSQFDFLADLPADASLEGYLFPDTYRFDANDPKVDVVTMLTNFGNKYTPEMRQRTKQMGLTIQDVVTLASLVEREAQIPEERPTIADIYLSRWEQDWRLEADPTVQYALGTADDWWPKLSGRRSLLRQPVQHLSKRWAAAWSDRQPGIRLHPGGALPGRHAIHVLRGQGRYRRARLRRHRGRATGERRQVFEQRRVGGWRSGPPSTQPAVPTGWA